MLSGHATNSLLGRINIIYMEHVGKLLENYNVQKIMIFYQFSRNTPVLYRPNRNISRLLAEFNIWSNTSCEL
jgi:hypothetical protein